MINEVAEQQQWDSEELKLKQIKIIFDTISFMAWMKDRDGKYIIVNKSFEERYVKKNTVIIGKTNFDIFEGNIATECKVVDDEVMKSKIPQNIDLLFTDNTGDKRWFDIYVAPILDDHGAVIGTIGTSRKITKRKKLEIEIENQKKFLKTMIDTIPDLIFYKDVNSVFLGGNKTFVQALFGLTEDEIIGKTDIDFVQNIELANFFREKDQEVFRAGVTKVNEERLTMINGNINDFETSKTPFYDEQGNVAGLIGISRNISARKQIENELLKREQQAQQELNLAARIQQEALPPNFIGAKVRVNTIFTPYETVGGDLVNYKWFEKQQNLRGYVVDVSGHGVSTALQTATVKMLLDNRLLGGKEIVEEDFQYINQRMLQYLSEESFAALLYFEFDFQTKILSIISAGINLFLAAKIHECALVPVDSCYLGVLEHADIQMVRMPFKAGEIYGMMSDGVSDLIEFHGLSEQKSFAEYTAWLQQLLQSPERRDDFSIVCIEILPEYKEIKIIHIQNDEELEEAQALISEFIEGHAPSCAGFLEVAVNEALNNAFRAGGRVCVKTRRLANRLIFRVQDDGPGFSTERVNAQLKKTMQNEEFDAEFDELLLEESGRGILIMKMFCDLLLYNKKGNEILLMKKI